MTMRMAKFALVAAVLAPLPSAAHHSYSMFDMNKTVAMQATIVRFKWQNPHAFIELDAAARGGSYVGVRLPNGSTLGQAG